MSRRRNSPPRKPSPPAPNPAEGTPLRHLLDVMMDRTADPKRRDRCAIAALPYLHPRTAEYRVGKKDREAEAARTAGARTAWVDDLADDWSQSGMGTHWKRDLGQAVYGSGPLDDSRWDDDLGPKQ